MPSLVANMNSTELVGLVSIGLIHSFVLYVYAARLWVNHLYTSYCIPLVKPQSIRPGLDV